MKPSVEEYITLANQCRKHYKIASFSQNEIETLKKEWKTKTKKQKEREIRFAKDHLAILSFNF